MPTKLQLRRGVKQGMPTLDVGEPGWVTDEDMLYVGTGAGNICINPGTLTVGSDAYKPLITTTNGLVTAGGFGNTANTFCEGDDSRLSDPRTPTSHTHGGADGISNDGTITGTVQTPTTNDFLVITDASQSNKLQRAIAVHATHEDKYLRQDGTWVLPPGDGIITGTVQTPTTNDFLVITDASQSNKLQRAIAVHATHENKYLRQDGTWVLPPGEGGSSFARTIMGNRVGSGVISISSFTLSDYDYIEIIVEISYEDTQTFYFQTSTWVKSNHFFHSVGEVKGGLLNYTGNSITSFGSVKVYPSSDTYENMFCDFLADSPSARIYINGIVL